jgi:hypothetical protein
VTQNALLGTWRIVEMDLWDSAAIDLLGPAFIEFRTDDQGVFQFVAVRGFMDVRYQAPDSEPRAEFSWEGDDDGDPRSGRGWVSLSPDGPLVGHVFLLMGDDASFRAVPMDDSGG